MDQKSCNKYSPFPPIRIQRTWPDKQLTIAPTWCSVDLRDGNQSLVTPMNLTKKLELFKLLVDIGFKEIEIGFPSASDVEYEFTRTLIEDQLIPDDVTVQVLTQAREHLIKKTLESLNGAKSAIVHLYNSTSTLQRKVVFNKSKDEIQAMAIQGVKWIQDYRHLAGKTTIRLEYSPESFSSTEVDFSAQICDAVITQWRITDPTAPIIINLPSTVEYSTPNIHADQIEWVIQHMTQKQNVQFSLHTHNDRGTGIAATELGLLAGATRVEGTLFGNGERTGNADIVTLALNMYTQGVNPNLNFHHLDKIKSVYQRCTLMDIHDRHPYAGALVFTAFSGSHQDAINKGMALQKEGAKWEVPYLPIDPTDIGQSYEAIIRINSQSGKGGVAYVMENEFGFHLPKAMHPEFGAIVQRIAEDIGDEVSSLKIKEEFEAEYFNLHTPIQLIEFKTISTSKNTVICELEITYNGQEKTLNGEGNGPIDACKNALNTLIPNFTLTDFSQHSISKGSTSKAVAYIQVENDHHHIYGCAVDENTTKASIKALISALNRLDKQSK